MHIRVALLVRHCCTFELLSRPVGYLIRSSGSGRGTAGAYQSALDFVFAADPNGVALHFLSDKFCWGMQWGRHLLVPTSSTFTSCLMPPPWHRPYISGVFLQLNSVVSIRAIGICLHRKHSVTRLPLNRREPVSTSRSWSAVYFHLYVLWWKGIDTRGKRPAGNLIILQALWEKTSRLPFNLPSGFVIALKSLRVTAEVIGCSFTTCLWTNAGPASGQWVARAAPAIVDHKMFLSVRKHNKTFYGFVRLR